ncbi:SusC/RagA family TonB-linked outer membrane protein [Alistipes sp. D31t1_170403_E11]|uniref:SusC/RagA family TonB-linked outer membrane protein n=1 Tax=Alistipes sp. D31t1_170403_E11 TaxID=2787128 RepID=UPI00189883BC|nr:SusC/RagA family TonB-linked outer membrane protein [Alistipes sp. D31t1_170403_E11]
MKNKLQSAEVRQKKRPYARLICLFFFFTLFSIPELRAQKVTLLFSDAKIERIMEEITRQTNLPFAFSREVVDVNRTVSIQLTNADLGAALTQMFAGTRISFRITDRRILLADRDTMKQNGQWFVTGKVTDENGSPIVGATVLLQGTTRGTTTNADGDYRIAIQEGDTSPVLLFSFIGYDLRNIPVSSSRSVVNVTMKSTSTAIQNVVVTALGLTREEKSLGYAVSKVNNEQLNSTVSSNWLNSMAGKVAGLNLEGTSSGPGGSIRVTLRGEGSLSHDKNTALFVVDGIPINSDMTASSSASQAFDVDAPIDYGNGASDLNPEDIESVSVLKGPAATALYGSRAANGAIIITTKSGRTGKGIGVTFNSSFTFERAGFWPDFQTEYGAGNGNLTNIDQQRYYNYWSVKADEAEDGIAAPNRVYSRMGFGSKFEGQMFYQYESRNWETGKYHKLPWKYNDNWYKGLFQTGITYNNSISVEGSNGKGSSVRLSLRDSRNDWIIPNTGYKSQNISFSVVQKLNRFITFKGKVTYYRKNSDNLPMSGYNPAAPLYTLLWNPTVIGVDSYAREYNNDRIRQMYQAGTEYLLINSSYADNVYMQLYQQLNTLDRDRVYGNVAVTLDLHKNLTLDLRSGIDFYNDFRTQQKPWYSSGYQYGYYKEQTVRNFEMNNDFLLTYKKRFGDFDLTASFGGNNMVYNYQNVQLTAKDGLQEYNIFKISNSKTIPYSYARRSNKSVNSFYGLINLSWKDMLYLDITGRNDWSSALARGNNSYFYPSVSASVLIDKIFNFSDKAPWINLLKVRGSWANVGNDTSPYSLNHVYSTSSFASAYYLSGTIQNPNIKPENVESYEVGLEARLFDNIWSFDATYYNSRTTDQIIGVPVDQTTGATSMLINAGEVRNKGVELSTRIVPVRTEHTRWEINLNWSKNWNKLVSLAPGVEVWQLNSGMNISGNIYINAYPGKELGRLYGRGYKRAPEGAFYTDAQGRNISCAGQVVVDQASGAPVLTGTEDPLLDLGSIYPDWKAGMTHTFSYKNLKMALTFTGQWGGNAYSVTHFALAYQGKLKNSLPGRYAGLIHEGVNLNADGTYQKNTTITRDIADYYSTYVYARENAENNTFDTSFLKLKELRIEYALPSKICRKTKFIQGASLAFYATNLFCWTNFPIYDPEAGYMVGSSISRGIEAGAYPLTRTYGFNLKLNF